MGKLKDWLFGRKDEPQEFDEEVSYGGYDDGGSTTVGKAYVGPAISPAQAAKIEAHLAVEDDYVDVTETDQPGTDLAVIEEAPAPVSFPPGTPGWKRKGRPYVHFRTVKIVDREDGFKFKVFGRSGKPRFKSDFYTEKSNAKRAAIAWVKKQGIPTKFVDDQYNGQVVLDTINEED